MKKFFYTLALTCALTVSTICTALANPLKVASCMSEKMTKTITEGFTAATQIPVEVVYLPSGSFDEKLDFLYKKNVDCVLGPTQDEFYAAERVNMLVPYASEQLNNLPEDLQPRKNSWTNLWVGYVALLSNKENLNKMGIYAPDTWLELLGNNFKDEIVLPEYESSIAGFSSITGIWQIKGEAMALHYAHEFNKQKIKFVKSEDDAIADVIKGKHTVTILPLHRAMKLESENENLYASIIQDANREIFTGVALLRGLQQEAEAQKFVDYLLSDDCVNLLANNNVQRWHVKFYSSDEERQRLIGSTQIAVDDLGWISMSRKDIIKRWKKA